MENEQIVRTVYDDIHHMTDAAQQQDENKQLEGDLKNKLVIYNNNPILKWCIANTQAKVDLNGNIQPSKLNSRLKRIDGCVALIITYAVLTRYKNDYESMIS